MSLLIDDLAGDIGTRYGRDFFARAPDDVAIDLIGSLMMVRDDDEAIVVQIVESEAYGGDDDAASHAFSGPTTRCRVMFGPPGHLYVYRIYGVHWCMNVVTGAEGSASAVLLRAGSVRHRWSARASRGGATPSLRGPGNLTRALEITGVDNGVDCCAVPVGRISFFADAQDETPLEVSASARVGVSRNVDRPSRYFAAGHPDVSRFVAGRSRG